MGSPLPQPEYMRLPIKLIPDETIQKYNLKEIEEDGMVYLKIVKGMHGLSQAGKIANELLIKRMRTAGYHPCRFTPGLWRHMWRPVTFTLVVDNFGIKFKGEEHTTHLKKDFGTMIRRHSRLDRQ